MTHEEFKAAIEGLRKMYPMAVPNDTFGVVSPHGTAYRCVECTLLRCAKPNCRCQECYDNIVANTKNSLRQGETFP